MDRARFRNRPQRLAAQPGGRAANLYAGWTGAEQHEGQQAAVLHRVGRRVRTSEGGQDAAAQGKHVIQAFQAGWRLRPVLVAKIA